MEGSSLESDDHGDLISRLLLSGDGDGEISPVNSDEEFGLGRRKRSPSTGSDAPKPKKMPRPKARPPATVHGQMDAATGRPVLMTLVPKARSPAIVAPRKLLHHPTSHIALRRPKPPAGQPMEEPAVYEQRWRELKAEVEAFYEKLAWSSHGEHAQQILARHSSRLGPVAARGLEEAVSKAVYTNSEHEKAELWQFLQHQSWKKWATSIATTYSQRGRNRITDEAVLAELGILECRQHLGDEVFTIPMGDAPPLLPSRPQEGHKADFRLLKISEIRFAHNDQSEHFVHCTQDCSILQLAVELLTGLTPLEKVPPFNVCSHDGEWYCRSGNRRLAAFMLAATFAPSRFCCVWAKIVPTDSVFLYGANGRPKLTTHLNGEACKGRWLLIKETGEAVGVPSALNAPPYGADLLALLPQPSF